MGLQKLKDYVLVAAVGAIFVWYGRNLDKNTDAVSELAKSIAAKDIVDKNQDSRLDRQGEAIKDIRQTQSGVLQDIKVIKSKTKIP